MYIFIYVCVCIYIYIHACYICIYIYIYTNKIELYNIILVPIHLNFITSLIFKKMK